MREFIETAKILSEAILEGEVHELAPDVGAIIEVFNDDGTIDEWGGRPRTYRVNGWLKAAAPLPPEPDIDDPNTTINDILSDILARGNREFDMGRGPTRLVNCTRQDAEYVSGSGVSGIIKPIDKVRVVGRVNWPEEQIEELRANALRRVGNVLF